MSLEKSLQSLLSACQQLPAYLRVWRYQRLMDEREKMQQELIRLQEVQLAAALAAQRFCFSLVHLLFGKHSQMGHRSAQSNPAGLHQERTWDSF